MLIFTAEEENRAMVSSKLRLLVNHLFILHVTTEKFIKHQFQFDSMPFIDI